MISRAKNPLSIANLAYFLPIYSFCDFKAPQTFKAERTKELKRPFMSKENTSEDKTKSRAPRRPFPQHTLEEALTVAKALKNKNAGKPWKPILLANALGIGSGSTNFRDITSSSNKYGLTVGTWAADFISLSALGVSITKPTSPNKEIKDLQEAALKIDVFSKIYDYYRDSKLPSPNDKFFKNILCSV